MTDFKRVFVDTAPIIYYLENSPLYSEAIKRFFTMCIEKNIQVVTSAITVEEYLVYPYSSGQMDFVDNFKRFLDYKLRGQYNGFKAMDALQISSAIASRCDMFFTNDKQLRQEKEIPCMTMDDLQ